MESLNPMSGLQAERPDFLEHNWRALGRCQPDLVRRLEAGASQEHLTPAEGGKTTLAWRGAEVALDLEGPAREGVVRELDRPAAGTSGETLLFGLGLGETLETALVRNAAPILAWERDPALLLATLSRVDVADALENARVRFVLGTDLLDRCRGRRPASVRAHPVLGTVYARERVLVEKGAHGTAVALAEGRLFVDQVGECLRRLGYDPFTVDLRLLSLDELDHQLEVLDPHFLFEINHLPGTPEFCAARGLPYVAWEIDPSTDRVAPATAPIGDARIFTYRQAHVSEYHAAGYAKVVHTPLAADVEARRPSSPVDPDRESFASEVSFVGASMVARAKACRAEFSALVRSWAQRVGAEIEDFDERLDSILIEQRELPFDYRIPALLRESFGDFLDDHERRAAAGEVLVRPESLVGEIAASDKRLGLLAGISRYTPQVWGDAGWRSLSSEGIRYRGGAGHVHDLNRVYSNAEINLDIGRIYQSDIVTMRVFDVLACGGFALVEHSDDLERLFEVGVELDSYRSSEELDAKLEHWLAHPEERRAVAARGRAAVIERHSMEGRLSEMLVDLGPRATQAAG